MTALFSHTGADPSPGEFPRQIKFCLPENFGDFRLDGIQGWKEGPAPPGSIGPGKAEEVKLLLEEPVALRGGVTYTFTWTPGEDFFLIEEETG